MISEEMQIHIKEQVFDNYGRNRIRNAIILKETYTPRESEREFEKAYPHFVKYRDYPGCAGDRYINSHSEELWEVVFARKKRDNYPYNKMIIDATIDEKLFDTLIKPQIISHCTDIEFFW